MPLFKNFTIIVLFILVTSSNSKAQKAAEEPFTIENYYKAKWGFAEEFINLWKTNHYPILKKAMEKVIS
jgi:hypothetical protein